MSNQKTVFVGLSGGVDSSVAAARLKAQDFKVVGVFIKVWHPDFMVCNWEAERLDAMRVAAHLGIPFLTCDAEVAYRDDVAKYFIEEYRSGRTPNPDVMCNQYVKFGAFLDFAKQHNADYIATGHYAQKIESADGSEMYRGLDSNKDQTYFLWTLSNEQLEMSLFPIGDTSKDKIRLEAASLGIPVANKKDSQGVCFLGHIDIPEFLSHYIDLEEGNVLDVKGSVIGKHKGALVYTLGQRHGFTLCTHDSSRQTMFVISKDVDKNTLTVSDTKQTIDSSNSLTLKKVVLRHTVLAGDVLDVQFRYRQASFQVTVVTVDKDEMIISSKFNTEEPALGQSCVLYRDLLCIGGGVIS